MSRLFVTKVVVFDAEVMGGNERSPIGRLEFPPQHLGGIVIF